VGISIEQVLGDVAIRVTDKGIGMTPAQAQRVGERFYRADTSGKVSGTGLGMSIVTEIMALHRGRVDIHSEPGSGTTVTLMFPLANT
jgi:signal transduction histidine kinase